MGLIDDVKSDFVRHEGGLKNLAFWAMLTYRFGRWADQQSGLTRKAGGVLYGAMMVGVEVTTGITLHREVSIGSDFRLIHSGNIKIHPKCVIGDRVSIMHDVTLGDGGRTGFPIIGNDVFIGAGAKVLGPVRVGNGARIAANSLVVANVPEGATAIGVPAKILRFTGRETSSPDSPSA